MNEMKPTRRAIRLSHALLKANEYIQTNAYKADRSLRPTYHLTPLIGWMNDPNGFCRFNGAYHLFWQYNPYDAKWDTMHWGHAISYDLVRWQHMPVALAPDKPYDWGYGCFSGTAIEVDGKLCVMYTCVDEDAVQQQALAFSQDGIHFEKYERNPTLPASKVPEKYPVKDIRDPYLFHSGDRYYALLGTKTEECGNILLYRSIDLKRWKFVGPLFEGTEGGKNKGVYECPSLWRTGDKDVLFYSAQFLPTDGERFVNIHSVVYMVGKLDIATGKFKTEYMGEVDAGFDFYAPQIIQSEDGRTLMTAWMQMWDRDYPTAQTGYVGGMILPRELLLEDGKLIQRPIREIESYRQNKAEVKDLQISEETPLPDFRGACTELQFTIDVNDAAQAGVKLFCGEDSYLSIVYDKSSDTLCLDRGNCGPVIKGSDPETDFCTRKVKADIKDGKIDLRVFLDNTCVEVFLNGGRATLTANVYPPRGADGVALFATGGTARLIQGTKYDIVVPN